MGAEGDTIEEVQHAVRTRGTDNRVGKLRRKLLRKLADAGDALALEAHEYGF
jgi:hypothetical protein